MTEYDLKKQSQFGGGLNYVKSVITMTYEGSGGPGRRKNKANSKPISNGIRAFFAYDVRDCHGPSGLAMTSESLLLCGLVPWWLIAYLKKQSQFQDAGSDSAVEFEEKCLQRMLKMQKT